MWFYLIYFVINYMELNYAWIFKENFKQKRPIWTKVQINLNF